MRIVDVLIVPVTGAGYYEDQAALEAGHVPLPQRFTAQSLTPGFQAVRQVARGVSIGLVLDDGRVAWGDCVAVAHSHTAGRAPLFRAGEGLATIRDVVAPQLIGQRVNSFREIASQVDALTETAKVQRAQGPVEPPVQDPSLRALLTAPARAFQQPRQEAGPTEWVTIERRLHPAIRYGASQALLQATALARGHTMAQVLAGEWDLALPRTPVPLLARSGHERHYHAEKMIIHGLDSLPHAAVDDISQQMGRSGDEMTRYLRWLAERIRQLGDAEYRPTIHIDLQGALGRILDNQMGQMLGQLRAWELATQPYQLRLEDPVIMDSQAAQLETLQTLRQYIRLRKMNVQIVAGKWANTLADIRAFVDAGAADAIQITMPELGSLHNTVEAVLACRAGDTGAFVGGSQTETHLSAKVSVHVALATSADLLLAKPGVGVDEAISLARNEMARTLAVLRQATSSRKQGD
jgi:methylaspartate ammonia-lyase